MSRAAHEALLAECCGYAALVTEEQEIDEDLSLVVGFADWLLTPGEPAEEYAGWSAADFRAEWDRWHS